MTWSLPDVPLAAAVVENDAVANNPRVKNTIKRTLRASR